MTLAIEMSQWMHGLQSRKARCRCGAQISGGTICTKCEEVATMNWRKSQLWDAYQSIPKSFRGCSFSSPHLRQWGNAWRFARQAMASLGKQRVVFQGPSGEGKTTLAVAMLRQEIDAGCAKGATEEAFNRAKGCYFIDVDDLGREWSESPTWESPSPRLAKCFGCRLLVLDDLGEESRESYRKAIAETIRKRHQKNLETILTTWKSEAELCTSYGDGVVRRFFEGATFIDMMS